MLDFVPPRHRADMHRIVAPLAPLILGRLRRGLRLSLSDDSRARLREAYEHTCVLMPNHCNHDDAYVIFALSAATRQPYYYLVARESFSEAKGERWRGRLMQGLGCYSVVRGAPDRESFRMTRRIIADGQRPLVIFPEGEVSHRADAGMPFEPGPTTLAFWGLADRASAGRSGPVLLVPIAIVYTVDPTHQHVLDEGLSRLEHALTGASQTGEPLDRLRSIGSHILDVLDNVYYGGIRDDLTISDRLHSIRNDVLAEIERFFGMDTPSSERLLDRARIVRNRIDADVYREGEPASPYERLVHERRARRLTGFYDAVRRVCAFHAVDLLALEDAPTLESLFMALWLLEEEVFGAPRSLVSRVAEVRVGDSLSLNDFTTMYGENKRPAVEHVTALVEA